MKELYQIKQAGQSYPILVKKSKFIASAKTVKSVKEAKEFIADISNSHHKANHNAWAYRIYKDGGIIQNADDDGEPSKTAGDPILFVLEKQNIANSVVVITRYFGGIKLGKGGLVRSYSKATSQIIKLLGIENLKIA